MSAEAHIRRVVVIGACMCAALNVMYLPRVQSHWLPYTWTVFVAKPELADAPARDAIELRGSGRHVLFIMGRAGGEHSALLPDLIAPHASVALIARSGNAESRIIALGKMTEAWCEDASYVEVSGLTLRRLCFQMEIEIEAGVHTLQPVVFANPPFGSGLTGTKMTRPRPVRITGTAWNPWMDTFYLPQVHVVVEESE